MRRVSSRARAALAAGVVAVVGLGAGWATTGDDGVEPAPVRIAALEDADGGPLPPALAAAARDLDGVDADGVARGRLLWQRAGVALAVVPTTDDSLCLLLEDATGGRFAGCGAALTPDRPAVALAVQRGGDLVLAGVVADGVRSVTPYGALEPLCHAAIERNVFTCVAPLASAGDLVSFAVDEGDGVETLFSAATVPAAPLPAVAAPPTVAQAPAEPEAVPARVPAAARPVASAVEEGPNLLPRRATPAQRQAAWRRVDRALDLVVLRPTWTNGVPLTALRLLHGSDVAACVGYEARWGPRRGRSYVLRVLDGLSCPLQPLVNPQMHTCAYGARVTMEDLRTAPGRRGRWRATWDVGAARYGLTGHGVIGLGEVPLSVVDGDGRRGSDCDPQPAPLPQPATEPPLWAVLPFGNDASRLVRVDRATLRPVAGRQARLGAYAAPVAYSPDRERVLVAERASGRALVRTVRLGQPASEQVTVVGVGDDVHVAAAAWLAPRRAAALVQAYDRGADTRALRLRTQRLVVFDPRDGDLVVDRPILDDGPWRFLPVSANRMLLARGPGGGHPAEVVEIDADGAVARRIPVPGAESLDGGVAVSPDGRRVIVAPNAGPLVELDLAAGTAATHPRPDLVIPPQPGRHPGEAATVAWIDAGRLVMTGLREVTPWGRRRLNHLGTWIIDATTWQATGLPIAASGVRVVAGTILLSGHGRDLVQRNGYRYPRAGVGIVALAPDGAVRWRRYEGESAVWPEPEPDGTRLYVERLGLSAGEVLDRESGAVVGAWASDLGAWLLDPAGPPPR